MNPNRSIGQDLALGLGVDSLTQVSQAAGRLLCVKMSISWPQSSKKVRKSANIADDISFHLPVITTLLCA